MAEKRMCSRCGGRGKRWQTVLEPRTIWSADGYSERLRAVDYDLHCFWCEGTGAEPLELRCPSCRMVYSEYTATWVGWVEHGSNDGNVWICGECQHLLRKRRERRP